MLHLIKKGLLFTVSILMICCGKDQRKKENSDEKDRYLMELEAGMFSRIKSNYSILKALNDSISDWKQHKLKGWYGDETKGEGKIDSLFALNKDMDKAIFISLARDLTDGKLDALGYVYGVKIENKWYFFSGPVLFVGRKDLSRPTSFSELHQRALELIFRGYLKKTPTGEWEINEKFFSDLTGGGICYECKTQEDFDKVYLEIVNKNWRHKATKQYLPSQ